MSRQPAGILLAAGLSQRFGSNKLLHPIIGDVPMLMVSAKKLASELPGSVVVINECLKNYITELEQLGLQVVINEQTEKGMGGSIACGIRHSSDASGWLIALADMPYIRTETLSLLVNKINERVGIVAPHYEGQRGHPVGFHSRFRHELLALNKDEGAREIIKRHHNQLELLPTDDHGVIRDVDYIQELV